MQEVAMTATAAPAASPALWDDSDLADRAARGHQEAFEELYRRHVQPAWRMAQAVTTSWGDAERATRAAFIRVLRLVRRGRPAAAEQFRPYLLAAVYRNGLSGQGERGQGGRDRV